ncbi:hypothetical protein Rxycam_02851 [Rubrobacter xylanophilus DSM 9941]|nr:hypothetical protein Rxycam_02851 [Rubrobacter xylanophilus DSM 9941]
MRIFRPERIPGLSRIPKELLRRERFCERCGRETEHIVYRVPKRVLFLYVKEHAESLQESCVTCARSAVIRDREREELLSELESRSRSPGG